MSQFLISLVTAWVLVTSMFVFCGKDADSSNIPRNGLYSCIQNCAQCVQLWERGLYNGKRCANACMRLKGRRLVDPECSNPRMFNFSQHIIRELLAQQSRGKEKPSNSTDNVVMHHRHHHGENSTHHGSHRRENAANEPHFTNPTTSSNHVYYNFQWWTTRSLQVTPSTLNQ